MSPDWQSKFDPVTFGFSLSPAVECLLSGSEGLGGELSHFAIGRERLNVAGPAALLLAILEGAEVSRGVSPVCACSYWPAPERCGLKHCGFLTPADLRTPRCRSMSKSSDTRRQEERW